MSHISNVLSSFFWGGGVNTMKCFVRYPDHQTLCAVVFNQAHLSYTSIMKLLVIRALVRTTSIYFWSSVTPLIIVSSLSATK